VTGEDAVDAGTHTEVLGAEALIDALQQRAQAAVAAGSTVRNLTVRAHYCPCSIRAV
jgi:hypothetical protein